MLVLGGGAADKSCLKVCQQTYRQSATLISPTEAVLGCPYIVEDLTKIGVALLLLVVSRQHCFEWGVGALERRGALGLTPQGRTAQESRVGKLSS